METPQQNQPVNAAKRGWRGFISRERFFGIIIGVVIGVYAGLLWVRRPPRIPPELAGIHQKMSQLRQGMNRQDLEKIFTHRVDERDNPLATRYIEQGHVIEVAYDAAGGPGSPKNRVKFYELKGGRYMTRPAKQQPR